MCKVSYISAQINNMDKECSLLTCSFQQNANLAYTFYLPQFLTFGYSMDKSLHKSNDEITLMLR